MEDTQIPKKEKGTYKSTPDSVKNQVKDTKKEARLKENTLILVNRLLSNILKDKAYLIDENQIRQYDSYIRQINQIRQAVLVDPRYPHQIIQDIVDSMYRRDSQIKGASIDLIFADLKNNLKNYIPNVRSIF